MSRLDERQQRILTTHTGSLPRPDALSTLFLIAAIVAFVSGVLSFALTRQSDFVVQGVPEAAPAG